MAYNKHTWVARQGVGLNKFTDQNGNKYEFTPSPDEVTRPGTPFSAEWMNEMEEQLEKAAVLSGGAVEGNFPMFNALGELINSGKGADNFIPKNGNIIQMVGNVFTTLDGNNVKLREFVSGSYVGDGTGTAANTLAGLKNNARKISLGLVPIAILLFKTSNQTQFTSLNQETSLISSNSFCAALSGDTLYVTPVGSSSVIASNANGVTYYWVAFA